MNVPALAVLLSAALVHLAACLLGWRRTYLITKPLLVPLLLVFYLLSASAVSPLVVLALVCGTAGDAALEVPCKSPDPAKPGWPLLLGLTAFLLGHLFYCAVFLRAVPAWRISSVLPLLLCAAALFLLVFLTLRPHMGPLTVPGTAYLAVLLGMAFSASLSALTIPAPLRIPGALLFLLSDYVLARSILFRKGRYTDFVVMLTYLAAQFLLVLSLI